MNDKTDQNDSNIHDLMLDHLVKIRAELKAQSNTNADRHRQTTETLDRVLAHDYAHHRDFAHLEERVAELEHDVKRLRSEADLGGLPQ